MRRFVFLLALILCGSALADPFGVPAPFLLPVRGPATGIGNTIAFTSVATNCGANSTTCAIALTYTGTAPSTTGWSGTWNSPCSGTPTITISSVTGGTVTGITTTPSATCTGTLTVTDNLSNSATSANVYTSPWQLVAQTTVGYCGNVATCTTPAINDTGANLVTVDISFYSSGGSVSVLITDKISGTPTGTSWTNRGNDSNVCTVQLLINVSPTVGANHTYTWTATGNAYGVMNVAAWKDTSGTPTITDSVVGNTSNTSTVNTTSHTPPTNNSLVNVASCNQDAPITFSGIDSGFAVSNNQNAGSSQNVGGVLAYLLQATAAALNPTLTYSASDNLVAIIFAVNP